MFLDGGQVAKFCKGARSKGKLKVSAQRCQTSNSHEWIFRKFNFSAWIEIFAEFQAFQEVISPSTIDMDQGSGIFSLTMSDASIIFSFQCLFSENIFDRVKSNFENIGFADLLFKVSVFVLRCIFGYYSHRSRKLARNLNIGQYFQYLLLQFWKGTIWNLKFS